MNPEQAVNGSFTLNPLLTVRLIENYAEKAAPAANAECMGSLLWGLPHTI
jgi:hypothetical protein